MRSKNILLITILFSLLFIVGCSADIDCSEQDTTYKKYEWNENLETCELADTIPKDVCGNGILEDGETYCSCSDDVDKEHPELGCSGELGDYLEKSCTDNNLCSFAENKKVVEETKSIEFKNRDLIFDGRVTLDNPYILNTISENNIEFEIKLFKPVSESYNFKNIKVEEIEIKDRSGVLLGSITYNEKLSNFGQKLELKQVELSDTTGYETKQTIMLDLIVSYTKETLDRDGKVTKTEEKIETLQSSLGRITIINPDFYEE